MDIKINKINLSVPSDINLKDKLPVIFLHGFTQSSSDWNFVIENLPRYIFPIAVDFIGHGKSESPENLNYYIADAMIENIKSIYNYFKIDKALVVGYSMGGRAALSFASKYSEKVLGLILESTSPGLEDKNERVERVESDRKIIELIEKKGIEEFVKYWMEIPLFNSLKSLSKKNYDRIVKSKLKNNPLGLINSLKGFGTGVMPNLWTSIDKLSNVLLITGALDEKFTELNKKMASQIKDSKHEIINNCGHNIHLEKPNEFIILVNNYLKKFESEK